MDFFLPLTHTDLEVKNMLLKYENILSANPPNLPGIYKFTNKLNGKVYIGKSIELKTRLSRYKNYFKKNNPGRFYRAVKKYNWENFSLEILEIFPSKNEFIANYILDREAFWIAFYNATDPFVGYNISSYGGNTFGFKFSDEEKEKHRREKNHFFGKKHSPETRKKMSLARKGIPRTEEEKQKLRDYYKTHKNPNLGKKFPEQGKIKQTLFGNKIKQINPITGETLKIWPSIREASRKYSPNGRNSNISGAIKNGRIAYGFKWVRVPKEELP